MAYMLHIVSFSNDEVEGLNHVNDRIQPREPRLDARDDLLNYQTSGGIWTDRGTKKLKGRVQHKKAGEAELSNIVIPTLPGRDFTFDLQIDSRADVISFRFFAEEAEGLWIGEYEGRMVGKGRARCCLVKVDDRFYDYHVPARSLARPLGNVSAA